MAADLQHFRSRDIAYPQQETVARMAGSSLHFTDGLRRLWSGDLPLSEAFWTWAVAAGLAINVTTSGLFLALMLAERPIAALVVGYGLSLPYNLVAVVGVWRSAKRYQGDRRWSDLARITVVFGMLLLSVT